MRDLACLYGKPISHSRGCASAQRLAFNGFKNFAEECFDEECPSLGFGNTACPQKEKRHSIEFARRCAMAAFDVIGQDLEFRLDRDLRLPGQKHGAAHLARIGSLCVGPYPDAALIDAPRIACEDAAKSLPACRVRPGMGDDSGIVTMAAIGDEINTIELRLRVFLREIKQRFMTRKQPAFGQVESFVGGGGIKLAQGNRRLPCGGPKPIKPNMFEPCSGG